jgi:uncharacterized membrane protein HdeD (DUF308 family)
MGLDIRFPIGYMFSIVGVLLVVASFLVDEAAKKRSLGININLYWGVFLVLFGVVMLVLAYKAKKAGGKQ